jgi:hypothetical protein
MPVSASTLWWAHERARHDRHDGRHQRDRLRAPEGVLVGGARDRGRDRARPVLLLAAPAAPGISVALQTVEQATEGPRRLHLDADVPDIEAAKARIVELGGSVVADREMQGFRWTTMADPEGNEFCIASH